MTTLAENVANWLGRVELVVRGADEERRAALRALERGDPLEARHQALQLLQKAPASPVGLALWVEACEEAWLHQEALDALRQLCDVAPWRGELWVKLGQTLEQQGAASSEVLAAYQKALEPETDSAVRRSALLKMVDADLRASDPWRARQWLDALRMYATLPEVALRRLEVGLALGDKNLVRSACQELGEPQPLDGRACLACARARLLLSETPVLEPLLRALILDTPGTDSVLASYLAASRDVVEVDRIRQVLASLGRESEPAFALAFALAEGRSSDAQSALASIAKSGDMAAARSLYDIALERLDEASLRTAVEVLGSGAPPEALVLMKSCAERDAGRGAQVLEMLDALSGAKKNVQDFAHQLRCEVVHKWLVSSGAEGLELVLTELRRAAAALDRLDLVVACESLAVEQQRPLRVAVVGEFNAGKSTFINALLGSDVAPTGILPTTASLHWLSWAPDPFARIVRGRGPDRIVSHEALKAALLDEQSAGTPVREVHICAPLERLRRIEVLDTPGFNAPEVEHISAAKRALQEAHVALWILDGTQPLKHSERQILSGAATVGTPVQVLVNKSDRLTNEQQRSVLSHVAEGLHELGLVSVGPVLGFSAKQALAGRLGDQSAYDRSGWDQVETLLSAEIVNRSEQWRASAIRRKALYLATDLEKLAAERQQAKAQGAGRSVQSQATERSEQAARLLALDRDQCEHVVKQLEHPLQQLTEDLRPLRVASMQLQDPYALAYAEARLVARLAQPLAALLVQQASIEAQSAALLVPSMAWVLRGAGASVRDGQQLHELLSWRLVRACAVAGYERLQEEASRLGALSLGPSGPWVRLVALRQVLSEHLLSGKSSGTVLA